MKALKDLFAYLWALWSFVLFCFFFFVFFLFSFEWKRGPSMWTHWFYVTYHMYHRGFAGAIAQKVISLSHFPRTKGYFSLFLSLSFFSSFFVDLFKIFFFLHLYFWLMNFVLFETLLGLMRLSFVFLSCFNFLFSLI